jgi:hypothetical protein
VVQVQSNQVKKCYDVNHPSIDYPEPDWSSMLGDATAQELFTRIFSSMIVSTPATGAFPFACARRNSEYRIWLDGAEPIKNPLPPDAHYVANGVASWYSDGSYPVML